MFTVVTPKEFVPEAEREMLAHGCCITYRAEHGEVTFPEDTTRSELLPRMPGGERMKLVLPDGYVMYQRYVRYLDQYILFCSREGMLTGQAEEGPELAPQSIAETLQEAE